MKKGRSFEENIIQNFQIEQEFDQLMQIEGLSLSKEERREVFPSIKHLFHSKTTVNIVGEGPNANIRSFYYLILCNIRKQHFKKLLNEMREKQHREMEDDEETIGMRSRKVSFNGKGGVFLNGPQYQNYGLHKLRIFAFSKDTDLQMIENSPFNTDKTLMYRGQTLTCQMLKKLLSEFLKQILPTQLPANYKTEIRSMRYYLNEHKCIGIILTILMRFILLDKYEIESARNYQEQINDHTVCTTLCDAFAIDGLICKDHLYEINTWCKVYSLKFRTKKTFFIQMFNDQFEELGSGNDKRKSFKHFKEVTQEFSISSNQQSSQEQEQILSGSAAFGGKQSQQNQDKNQSEASSSMMGADEDSEISYEAEQWQRTRHRQYNMAESQQFKSLGQGCDSSNNNTFRQTFNSNKYSMQAIVLNQIKKQEQESKMTINEQTQFKRKQSYDAERHCVGEDHSGSLNKLVSDHGESKTNFVAQPISAKPNYQPQFAKKVGQNVEQQGCTSTDLFEKLTCFKSKIKLIKIGFHQNKQQSGSIVNNNINNNIYVNLGPGNNGHNNQYMPVINISTPQDSKNAMDPNSYIKINLV